MRSIITNRRLFCHCLQRDCRSGCAFREQGHRGRQVRTQGTVRFVLFRTGNNKQGTIGRKLSFLADLTDDNLVNVPENVTDVKQLNLYSQDNLALYFVCHYLHDEKNNRCFFLDSGTETAWMIGHELMKQLI
jgi:hypothetical protein